MKNILILHGWGGSDNPHWQAWLADELKAKGYHVRFPSLDDRDLPTLDAWLTILHQEINYQKPDIIVTHSLGNMLYFHYQKKYGDLALEKLLLVAPVSQQCQIPELCEFFPYPTPIQNSTTLLVGSTNDPYIKKSETEELAQALKCELKILDNALHINGDSNYGEWPFVLSWVIGE